MTSPGARYLASAARLYRLRMQAQLEYRADFVVGVLGALCLHCAGFGAVWLILRQVPDIAGWTIWQLSVTYALAIVPGGLCVMFLDGMWELRHLVVKGEFDQLLTRPVSPLLQLCTLRANPAGAGDVALGLTLLVLAARHGALPVTAASVAVLVVAVLNGVVVVGSLNLATNSLVFWDGAEHNNISLLVGNTAEMAKFPLTLYDSAVRFTFTFVLPFGLLSYYPALALESDGLERAGRVVLFVLGGAGTALAARLVWRAGLKRYQGAG
ncbi:ABC transporter permease [Streptomyces sp. NPDC058534]|uniref:ABC transporter permease n=1 Tax=Streptomyces sp. NPDC058534 TaxID=3346541 RepID=UPI00365E0B45